MLTCTPAYICDECHDAALSLDSPWRELGLPGWVGNLHACSSFCAAAIAAAGWRRRDTIGAEMPGLKAEFFTVDKATKKRKRVFQWAVPDGLSLDEAKSKARERATAAGYRVTTASFRRGVDTGEVAGIIIYMEKSNA